MRKRDKQAPETAEEAVRDIRRATKRHFAAEEKICIVLERLRGEGSIAELCRKAGIAEGRSLIRQRDLIEAQDHAILAAIRTTSVCGRFPV